MRKIECFNHHKHGHCASQCLDKKKSKGEQHQTRVATFAKTQMNKFTTKFEKHFSLVTCLSTNTIPRNIWYVDNGASRHMTSSQQLFSSMKK
jgi:hypothetical protein